MIDKTWEFNIADDDLSFHYTSQKIALNFILKEKGIRFTPFGKLKDPRESKKWSFDIIGGSPSNMEDYITKQGIIRKEFNDFIKKKYKDVLAMTGGYDNKVSVRVLDWQEGRPQLMDDLTWFNHKKFE